MNVPEADPLRAEETLYQVLAGVRAALDPLGVSLVGGHTTQGGELYVGLAITGELAGEPLPASGLAAGQHLVLSKPLGSGVLLAADMRGLLAGRAARAALRGPRARERRRRARGARGRRDGLHRRVRLRARRPPRGARCARAARRRVCSRDALPALPGARELLARGVRSTFHEQNARAARRGSRVAAGRRADRIAS